jgi:predicted DNA-binding transcriptional regulator AlpA
MAEAFFLFHDDLDVLTGLAVSTRDRLEQRGRFPRRVHIAPRRVGWRKSDVEAWAKDPENYSQQTTVGGGA